MHRDAVEELVQTRVGAVEIVDPGVALAVRSAIDRDQELRPRVRLAGARHDSAQQRGEARRLNRPVPVAVGLVVDLEVGRGHRGVELGMGAPEVSARAVAAREGRHDARVFVHVSRERARLLQERQDAQPTPGGVRVQDVALAVRHRVELLADPADAHRLHAVELERSLRAPAPAVRVQAPADAAAGGSHPGPGVPVGRTCACRGWPAGHARTSAAAGAGARRGERCAPGARDAAWLGANAGVCAPRAPRSCDGLAAGAAWRACSACRPRPPVASLPLSLQRPRRSARPTRRARLRPRPAARRAAPPAQAPRIRARLPPDGGRLEGF